MKNRGQILGKFHPRSLDLFSESSSLLLSAFKSFRKIPSLDVEEAFKEGEQKVVRNCLNFEKVLTFHVGEIVILIYK